jgi:ABC-type transport system substrate-binding protein
MTSKSWLPSYIDSRITRRRFLKGTAAGAGAAALLACGGDGDGGSDLKIDTGAESREPGTVWFAKNNFKLPDESAQAVRGGIYRDHLNADVISHWDPTPQESANAGYGAPAYEFLMHRNRGPGVDPTTVAYQTPVPALSEGMEIGADGLSVIFTLRKGVKWSNFAPVNGREMDIDDWRTSTERHFEQGTYARQLDLALEKVSYPDADHMVWHLKAPLAPLFDRIFDRTFAYHILPKEGNVNQALVERQTIGTGPRQLKTSDPSIKVEWQKNPDYWGGDPFIDEWHFPIIPEYANRYAQFVTGGIMNFEPSARDALQLAQDAPETVIVASELDTENACRVRMGKNNPQAFAWGQDPRVRIAIRISTDYKSIGEFLSNKKEFEAAGIPVEVAPMTHVMAVPAFWLDPEKGEYQKEFGLPLDENFNYNPALAKQLVEAAGFETPLHLPLHLSIGASGEASEANILVGDSMKQSGVWDLEVRRIPRSEFRVNYNINAAYDGIQQQSCSAGAGTDYVMFRDYFSSGHRSGPPAVTDPEIDRLAIKQRETMDIEERNAVFVEIQKVWAQIMPLPPGRHRFTEFSFRWPWLHNSNYAANRSSNPDLGLHKHWLDVDMPNRDTPL